MGISICLHYVHIHEMSHPTEQTRVKEKPHVDMYICVYARLKVQYIFGKASVSATLLLLLITHNKLSDFKYHRFTEC